MEKERIREANGNLTGLIKRGLVDREMMEAGPFRTKDVDAMRYTAACAVQLLDHTSDSTAAVSSRCRDVEWLELTSRSKISRLGAKQQEDHILFHNYMVDNERVVEVHGNEIEDLIAMVCDQKDIIARLEQRIEGQDQMIAKVVRLSEQVCPSVHRSIDRGPEGHLGSADSVHAR